MKKTRDVLFLLQFFHPEYVSSATLPFDTALALAKSGYSIDVLCGYPHEYSDKTDIPCKETVQDIHIRRIKYLQANRKKALGRIVNYLSLTVMMALHILSMNKYKAIIVYSNPPILPLVASIACKLFNCKLIFVAYDLYPEVALQTKTLSKNGIVTKLMNLINKTVYKNASAVVALSSEMKEHIVANRDIDSKKVYVIPNWFKDEYSSEDDGKSNAFAPITNQRFVVGYFGNMGIAQDMEPLKEAIKHYANVTDVCFLLSGHGSKYLEMKHMLEVEKIENAYLYGFLKGQEYLDALQASDCAIISLEKGLTGLCVPSKTYGFMMQGLPLIAIMDDSDIVRDIRNGAGYLVENNSPTRLIEVIAEAKDNYDCCKAKGAVSRQIYLGSYTPDICLKKYVQLMNDVLGQ